MARLPDDRSDFDSRSSNVVEKVRRILAVKPKSKEQQLEFLTGQKLMKMQFGNKFVDDTARLPKFLTQQPRIGSGRVSNNKPRKINCDCNGRPMNVWKLR